MKSKRVSRRAFLNDVTLVALAACLAGCTKTVTKYRADGTPYTVKEDDMVATLAGVVLLLLLLAAAAASKSSKSSMDHEDDWLGPQDDEGKVHLASATSKHRLPVGVVQQDISIKDPKGRLLASVDSFECVEHHDLGTAARLLANAQVSTLDQPVAIHLQQDRLDSYRIENIHVLKKSSCENFKVFKRRIKGKLYEVKVRTNADGSVDIEMISESRGSQGVA